MGWPLLKAGLLFCLSGLGFWCDCSALSWSLGVSEGHMPPWKLWSCFCSMSPVLETGRRSSLPRWILGGGGCRMHWSKSEVDRTVCFRHGSSLTPCDTEVRRDIQLHTETTGQRCKAWSCGLECLKDLCQWSLCPSCWLSFGIWFIRQVTLMLYMVTECLSVYKSGNYGKRLLLPRCL